MLNEIIPNDSTLRNYSDDELQQLSSKITQGVCHIIDEARQQVAIYVDAALTMTHWHVGAYVSSQLQAAEASKYGQKIVATVSQQLTLRYGRGYTYTALTRMVKVAMPIPTRNSWPPSQAN